MTYITISKGRLKTEKRIIETWSKSQPQRVPYSPGIEYIKEDKANLDALRIHFALFDKEFRFGNYFERCQWLEAIVPGAVGKEEGPDEV